MMNALPEKPKFRLDILAALAGVVLAILGTVIIWLTGPLLVGFERALAPDQGPAWYLWKLPQPDFWSHFTAWAGFGLNLVLAWACLVWGKLRDKKRPLGQAKFGSVMSPPGIAFAVVNIVFYFLHLGQTILFYDGLAQDVPVVSSQGSVIVMLVLILILMNERRGLFFGKKIPMPAAALAFIRRYHGFYIAWALIYTFWYHPMTNTPAHLAGFLYMLILLSQGGLMFTRVHANPRWVIILEVLVLVHGTTVALMQGTPLWTMFAFGFGFMFIVTQMSGLRLPVWANRGLTGLFVLSVLAVYSSWLVPGKNISQVHQVLWIPIIEYLLIPVFLGLAWLGSLIIRPKTESPLPTDAPDE